MARLVATALDLETLYLALHEQFQKVVDATGFALAITRGEGRDLDVPLRVLAGKREPVTRWPWSNGVVEYVIRTRRPLILADRAYDRAIELGCEPRSLQPPRSWIAAPVLIGGRVLGVLSAQHHERDFAFDGTDLDLLTALAQHVAVALENARLFDLLRQTEARYRTLFLDLPLAVFVLDESGRIQSLNPAATRLAGRAEAELAGQRLSQLTHPNERDAVERLIA
ncbi:MAG: GAF domain-containing protein, partial [Gemmatimonadota bacterium]